MRFGCPFRTGLNHFCECLKSERLLIAARQPCHTLEEHAGMAQQIE